MIDDTLRAQLRAAIDEAGPLAVARRTLELLAEPALAPDAAPPGYRVLGRGGEARRHPDGTPFALSDLVTEIRAQHPRLFEGGADAPAPPPPARATPAARGDRAPPRADARPPQRSPGRPPGRPLRDRLRPGVLAGVAATVLIVLALAAYGVADRLRTGERDLSRATAPRVLAEGGPAPDAPARTAPAVTDPDATASTRTGSVAPGGGPVGGGPVGGGPAGGGPAGGGSIGGRAAGDRPGEAGPSAALLAPAPRWPEGAATLTGTPEVVDAATLRLGGRVAHLAGIARERAPEGGELARYLGGRAVTCRPAARPDDYACEVDGRDLAEVVLYNGGARAADDATPELASAEDRARARRVGVWRKEAAPPR